MLEAAKSAFLPEFLNRIDEIVTFEALTHEQVERIAGIVVARTAERLREERGIELEVAPELVPSSRATDSTRRLAPGR
jgi:ATP-dependent Clp protease ATP-binding subunit ClpC